MLRTHRSTVAIVGLSVAALAGGTALAAAGRSGSVQSAGTEVPGGAAGEAVSRGSTVSSASGLATTATVRTAMARVNGVVEVILVNDRRLPLYIHKLDTATRSMVTGGLASLWPPLVAGAPTGSGTSGVLTVVPTEHGRHVTYNGHFLYTCSDDSPGQVTGQGHQNFAVVTPDVAPIDALGAFSTPLTTPTRSGTGVRC
jgi:predicted lipoprotein with Yx(FWY)xxD motif